MNRKSYTRSLLVPAMILAMFSTLQTDAQQWVHVGNPGFSPAGKSVSQRIIIDEYNTLYVSFTDEGQGLNSPQGTVMRYDDTGWALIGIAGFTPGAAQASALARGLKDTMYFSFADGTYSGFSRGRVMRYDGNAWSFLGDVLTVSECKSSNVVRTSDGNLYFGAVDKGAGGYVNGAVVVKKYNGTSWSSVGATVPASGDTAQVTWGYMEKDRHDTLWIAYSDNADGGRISVKKFNGTDWVRIGSKFVYQAGQPGSGGLTGPLQLAFDYNNTPYVVYSSTYMGPPMTSVHKFDGTDWVVVGASQFSGGVVTEARISFDRTNTPFVAFHNQGGPPATASNVMKFDGTAWVNVGAPGFTGDISAYPDIAVDGNGNPYFVYEDVGNGYKTSVMKYTVCDAPETQSVSASSTGICRGDTVMLTVAGTLHDATGWEWFTGSCGGTPAGSGDTIYVAPTDTTTYYVRGMGACVVSGPCAAVDIDVTHVPKPVIGADGDTLTSSASSGNQWYLDGMPINGATGSTYGISKTGWYSVKVNVGPCSNMSDSVYLEPTGIAGAASGGQIRVFPVPFSHSVHITFGDGERSMDQWSLQVTDQVGRTVYTRASLEQNNQIDLSYLPQGIYFIRLDSREGTRMFKVSKQ